MFDLSRHPYFEEHTDAKSGVKSHILKKRVAAIQQALYFIKMGGITTDGKYMWFRCIEPPSRMIRYAVLCLDPDAPSITVLNNVTKDTSLLSPIPDTHSALFAVHNKVYQTDTSGNVKEILKVSDELIHGRYIERISTHLSLNSTRELFTLDMNIGSKAYVAVGKYHTGEVKVIQKYERHYNHAQFSPTDPNLMIVDQDGHNDIITGERFNIEQRIWLMDVDGTRLEPVDPLNWYDHNNSSPNHDFWSQDGFVCWPDLRDDKVYEYNPQTREKTVAWKKRMCHCHTLDRKLWVGDASPYEWNEKPCKVIFFDRESGREIDIFSSLPAPICDRGVYHLDPHPSFSPDGNFIVSTTTVNGGNPEIAITPVDSLLKKCRESGRKIQ